MGEYVIEEFKKVKISLYAFELLKVPTIRHAFFRVINETPSSKTTQEIPAKRVTFEEPRHEPIIQEIIGKKKDASTNQQTRKQPAKEQTPMQTKENSNEKDKNQVAQADTPMGLFQGQFEMPPFLTTTKIFGKNFHNFLIDFGASANVMPLVVCKALGITPTTSRRKVTQLDKTKVNIIREINCTLM